MQYLLDSLEGPAKRRIRGLNLTGSSFEVAWQKLVRRFDNPTARMHTYMDTLIDLKKAKEESAEELMRLLDAAEVAAKVFTDLQCPVDQWDCWLVHLVVRKLDSLTKRIWRVSQESVEGFSTFKSLVAFLETRANSLGDDSDSYPESPRPDSQKGSKSHRFSKKASVSANATATSSGRYDSKSSQKCFECNGAHQIVDCSNLCQMNQPSRFECCRWHKLCILCLRRGHFVAECNSTYRCAVCKGKHHTKMHINRKRPGDDSKTQKDKSSNSDDSSNSGVLAHAAVVGRTRLMATAKVLLQTSNGNSVHARCLVDPCAEASFVSARIVECLASPVKPVSISVIGVGAGSSALSRGEVSLCLRSRLDVDFCLGFRALVLNKVTGVMPRDEVQFVSWEHISDLDLADPDFAKSRRVDCVLSAEVYAAIIRPGLRVGGKDEPIAQSTVLGWILTGKVSASGESVKTETQVCHARIEPSLSLILEKFWSFEEVCSARVLSKEDQYCEDYFTSTVYRDPDGRFVVRLPFSEKLQEVSFVHTRQVGVACLLRSEKRRAQDFKLKSAYSKFMGDYLRLGHMERVTSLHRSENVFYFTHHPIYSIKVGPDGKFRIVFNGSYGKISLNDVLLTGQKLQSDVTIILSIWRCFAVVFTADIVKEFRQIRVHPDDVDYQRIVWRDDVSKPIEDFRLLTVTYGTKSDPYLSIRTLVQLAQEGCRDFPLASQVLRNNMYVDDAFAGADSVSDAIEIRDQLVALLASAGMELGKWASNRSEILKQIQAEKQKELSLDWDEAVSTLGLKWMPSGDAFRFEVSLPAKPKSVTKRVILSEIAKLFDPLGWLAPVLVRAKLVLQDLWMHGVDWDTSLEGDLLLQWQLLRAELPELAQRAYVAAAYMVVPGERASLIMSKTKVAPIKTESLPRLELCGAVLLTRLLKHLLDGLMLKPAAVHCWTDSKVVLDWLGSHPSRWQTFVANRVSQIDTTLPGIEWRHVKSEDNPADCATRGFSPSQLMDASLWWEGPVWITKDWRSDRKGSIKQEEDLPSLVYLEKFSNYSKIVRIIGFCFRFRFNAAKPKGDRCAGSLTAEEMDAARVGLTRYIQALYFGKDIATIKSGQRLSARSPLIRLAPFICERGLLRVGGRLQNSLLHFNEKHPIVLPGSCVLVKRYVEELHRDTMHGGVQLMVSCICRTYWILRGMRIVQGVYRRCFRCIRYAPQPMQHQMAPLPAFRVAPKRSFMATGVDYAGPFPILFSRGRGAKSTKGYICIFVCMVVRAVHIEVVSDLTTAAFLAAFRRFSARRGILKVLLSDNGTNFKGAATELDKLFREASSFSHEVAEALMKYNTKWLFIPPRTPHFGGLWEASVKSFKHHFRRVVGETRLTFEEMAIVAAQIEACMNSRPLSPLSSEPNDLLALTPSHFLIDAPLRVLPEPFRNLDLNSRTCRWRHLTVMRNHFWTRWQAEVLHHLQQRNIWLHPSRPLVEGDLVLLKEDLSPPAHWPTGRVMKVHPGRDGQVRVVTVKTATSEVQRPVVKLIYLPTDEGTEKAHSRFKVAKDQE